MALRPISVTQLNDYIGRVLQTDPLLGNISVIGEISNLKYHSSGHIYFSIVDDKCKVNCFLPASYAENLSYQLGDGLEIIVRGYINVFKKGGTYTLFVRSIEVSGEGNLAVAFELLKEKLEKEGLFDSEWKKPIPAFPKTVGIVTSETGAAVKDILKIIQGRTGLTDIIIFPVLVQGDGAAEDIASMLDFINKEYAYIDTLIVGRGGGSMEDLWAFNEEVVARAIFRSKIPIISAVGHEIDFTISDFVADRRAETPTAAAEMAVPDSNKLFEKIKWYQDHLLSQLENKVKYHQLLIERYREDLSGYLFRRIENYRHQSERYHLMLEENKPEKILSKGYAVLESQDGAVITSVNHVKEGQFYQLILGDGKLMFRIEQLTKVGEENDI